VTARRPTAVRSQVLLHAVTLAALICVWADYRAASYVRYQAPPRPLMHANYYAFHDMSVRLDEGARFGTINLTRVSRRPFDRPYEPYDTSTPPGSTYCDYYTLDPGFGLIVHVARKLFSGLPDTFLRTLALQGLADVLALALVYGTFAGWSWLAAVLAAGLYATNPVLGYVVTLAFYYFWDGLIAVAVLTTLVWIGRFSRRRRDGALVIIALAVLGALLGFGVWLRASWATYAIVLFGALLLTRQVRRRAWVAIATFLIVAGPSVYRASRAEGHLATSARMLWHTAHQGLGRYPNPFGIEDDDLYQFDLAKAEYGVEYNYCSYRRQDDAMRDHYKKIWRADPWFVVRSVSSRVYDNLFWHAAAPGSSQSFWNWGLPGLAFIGGIWLFLRGGERRLVAIAAAALFLVACGAIGFVYYINDNYANITQIFLIVLAAGAADFVAALAPAWKRPRLRAIASLGRAHSIALASVLSATVAIAIVLSLPAARRFLSPPPPTEVWVEAQAPTSDDLRRFGEKWQAFAARELRVVRGYDFEARMSRPPVWVAREAAGPAFNALSKSASAVAGWRTRSVAGFEPDSPESWDGRLLRVELEPSTGLQQSRVEKLMIEKFNRWGFQLRERRGDEFVFRLE
jgi:hypothetical protein